MEPIPSLTDAQLAEQITTWSGRLAAGEAHLLALVAEFDARGAWFGPGLLSCAHWLVWRTGLSPGAAREKVRVARALVDLPQVQAALGAGRLSFSQARAVTRVATPDDQTRWVELCRHTTAAQLEKLVRGVARVRRSEQDAADPERARWRMRTTTSYDADGNLRLVITLPAQDGALVTAALEQVRARLDSEHGDRQPRSEPQPGLALLDSERPGGGRPDSGRPDDEQPDGGRLDDEQPDGGRPDLPVGRTSDRGRPGRAGPKAPTGADEGHASAETSGTTRASLGDALVELARQALERATPDRARRSRAGLTAQVDPLSGWARLADGELLPPGSLTVACSLERVLMDPPGGGAARTRGPRLRPLARADLTRLDLGRTARLPSQGLRDLLGSLDGERCRFPGCTRRRRLHAHHVRSWSDGGPTDLSNLVLVCSRHHTLVHQQGFSLALAADRRLSVATADGVPVLHHPVPPWGDRELLDPGRHVSAETPVPDRVEPRLDLHYCVAVLLQQAA